MKCSTRVTDTHKHVIVSAEEKIRYSVLIKSNIDFFFLSFFYLWAEILQSQTANASPPTSLYSAFILGGGMIHRWRDTGAAMLQLYSPTHNMRRYLCSFIHRRVPGSHLEGTSRPTPSRPVPSSAWFKLPSHFLDSSLILIPNSALTLLLCHV